MALDSGLAVLARNDGLPLVPVLGRVPARVEDFVSEQVKCSEIVNALHPLSGFPHLFLHFVQ